MSQSVSNQPTLDVDTELRQQLFRLADLLAAEETRLGREATARTRVELLEQLLGKSACRRLGIYPLPEGFVLSVVIPVFNEIDTVAEVVRRVRESGVPTEVILVDDGSTDGTRELLESWR